MRVLIILREFYSPSFPIGGAERQALQLANELEKNNISVKVVTGLWDWGQPRHEVIQDVNVDRHFSAWGMFGIRGFRRFGYYAYLLSLIMYLLWNRNKYEIIHCHSALVESSIAVLVGNWLDKPTLIRPMASGAFGDFRRLRERRSIWGQDWLVSKMKQADAIVALNPQIADEMSALGIDTRRIFFIPNGVEIKLTSHPHNYVRHDPMHITFVGRLHPQKNIGMLLKALNHLKNLGVNFSFRLTLLGTGPSKAELQTMASELEISRYVDFQGHVDCVDAILEDSDIFVLPSLSEGMSNALLEAMAVGLPCIVSDIPGNNDLIEHQVNGWLVPPDDNQALADAILMLATNEALRQRLGQQALETVQEHYSLRSVARQYAGLYSHLMDGKTT